MDSAVPSSRAPRAMRGASLATALRALGEVESAPQRVSVPSSGAVAESGTTEVARSRTSALADSVPPHQLAERGASPSPPDDEESAPAALRPDQLARWLERHG